MAAGRRHIAEGSLPHDLHVLLPANAAGVEPGLEGIKAVRPSNHAGQPSLAGQQPAWASPRTAGQVFSGVTWQQQPMHVPDACVQASAADWASPGGQDWAAQQQLEPWLPGLPCVEQQQQRFDLGLAPALGAAQQACAGGFAAAMVQGVAVPDLQQPGEVERQQQAAGRAVLLGGCVDHFNVPDAVAPPSVAGASAHGLGIASDAAQAATAAPGAVSRPGSSSSRSTSSAASPYSLNQRPLTAAGALRRWGHQLTPFEQAEILSFPHVWFVGRPSVVKVRGEVHGRAQHAWSAPLTLVLNNAAERGSSQPNFGFDDSHGDYNAVVSLLAGSALGRGARC